MTGFLANGQILRGRVIKEDGSALEGPVSIERICPGAQPLREAMTNRRGEFVWRAVVADVGQASGYGPGPRSLAGMYTPVVCRLRATLRGYESNEIDLSDPGVTRGLTLPDFILRPRGSDLEIAEDAKLPRAAAKPWSLAIKAMREQKWPEVERRLLETLRAVPNFAPAWSAIGVAYQKQGKMNDARDAFRHAIAADKTELLPYVSLMRIEAAERNWSETAKASENVIRSDRQHRYLEAYLDAAVAHFQLHELDAAETELDAGLAIDTKQTIPQFEYLLGIIHETKGHRAEAVEHFRKYLELAPEGPEAETTKSHVARLMDATAGPAPELPDATVSLALSTDPNVLLIGDAPVVGGIKALSLIAHVKPNTRPADFFLEYARAVARETSPFNDQRVPGYAARLMAYMTSVEQLRRLGDTRGDATVILLSLANEANARKTERILPLLGWKVVRRNGLTRVELGDRPEDDARQKIPRALGIDELAMQEALDAGGDFRFEIPRETAPLVGGSAWGFLLEGFPNLPGGVAEAFVRDPRMAKTYAGIASMTAETSIAVAKGVGLRRLMMNYADVLWLYSGAFVVKSGKTLTPGGAEAERVWEALSGANPNDAVRFLPALMQKDQGRLAAFYYALSKADAAHQRFFLHDVARAKRYYIRYRESDSLQAGFGKPTQVWRPTFFERLPLDSSGSLRFPGGKGAWTSNLSIPDDEVPLLLDSPEALVEVAGLEQSRKAPLDTASAKLLAKHFKDWRSLFPYFQLLTKLGPGDFQALAQFSDAIARYPYASRNLVMGHWFSMMALVAMGRQAGSLDDQAAARAFRQLCDLSADHDYFSHVRKVLRELVGSREDLDEAVAQFLRLSGPRRQAFDRVRELQKAPRLQSLAKRPEPEVSLEALAGVVYGAFMNPDVLLVSEDPALLKKHQYVARSGGAT